MTLNDELMRVVTSFDLYSLMNPFIQQNTTDFSPGKTILTLRQLSVTP